MVINHVSVRPGMIFREETASRIKASGVIVPEIIPWHILGEPYSLSSFEFSGILHVAH